MERESNPMQALCRSGCGFYGSPATDGLCSLCFKENLKKKNQLPTTASLSALRDTTTGQPTISHLPPSAAAALPNDQAEECTNQQAASAAAAACAAAQAAAACQAEQLQQQAAENMAAAAAAATMSTSSSSSTDSSGDDKDGDKDAKKKKNRCATCRKKVGLTGFECRCGGLFCAIHRYSDKHDCSFNYKEMGAQEIRRNNPVVVGEKIQKI